MGLMFIEHLMDGDRVWKIYQNKVGGWGTSPLTQQVVFTSTEIVYFLQSDKQFNRCVMLL